jgi:hypothetical protein
MKQHDKMRQLYSRFPGDIERIIKEYAHAEACGQVGRRSNVDGWSAQRYARALYRDGIRKSWLQT